MLYGLKETSVNLINSIFAKYDFIEKVIIYGSRAKGNYKNGSDIDLTIVDTGLSFSQLCEIENQLDDALLPYKIDLSQKSTISDASLNEHIDRVGKVFYEKGV